MCSIHFLKMTPMVLMMTKLMTCIVMMKKNDSKNDDIAALECDITEGEVYEAIRMLKTERQQDQIRSLENFSKILLQCQAFFHLVYILRIGRKRLFSRCLRRGDPENPDNYRGISFLSICSKLYSYILNKRLTCWIDENNLLSETQAGFRKTYSTTDNLFTLLAVIQKQLLCHKKLYVAFIDFRKAFDSVIRTKLWTILRKNGLKRKCTKR